MEEHDVIRIIVQKYDRFTCHNSPKIAAEEKTLEKFIEFLKNDLVGSFNEE